MGLAGAIGAGDAAELLSWQGCYLAGGLGLALLVLRLGVIESGLYERLARDGGPRGNPLRLLWPPRRLARFVGIVLCASPIWFVVGVLFIFAPEPGRAMGIAEPILAGRAIAFAFAYVGVVVGDVASGGLSQLLRSRRRALLAFIAFLAAALGMILVVGLATGYWAVFVTTASELFGTNLRATVAVSAPNVVRALAAPITSIWFIMKPGMGWLAATRALGLAICGLAALCALGLPETFGRDLDYRET